MSDRLPPLTALRAFEAASRHMSFAKAADELSVTPAALSFQIKSLEDHLGVPVFRRLNRAVELTEEGKLLRPGVAEGFEAIQTAWRSVKRRLDSTTLTITAGPGFTAKWLAPRLFSFAQANPDIELRFSASLRMMDLARDDIDVAIRFGQSRDDDLYSIQLIEEWSAPMTSPALAEQISQLSDLAEVPLLHQEDTNFLRPTLDWPTYFAAIGLEAPAQNGPRFSQADHAIDAALSGGGVVLGRISMTEAHLREGRLIMPFKKALPAHAKYRLVCPEGAQNRHQVARFIEWAVKETATIIEMKEGVEFLERA
jgi:LysR family glycine cleavage system transcriptional activator